MDQYDKMEYCVLTEEGRSLFFITTQGLKQGDPFSPRLFNLYIMDVIQIFNLESDPLFCKERLFSFFVSRMTFYYSPQDLSGYKHH